jgi:3-oxoacyl-[acyl-carrier-protein] synthase-1
MERIWVDAHNIISPLGKTTYENYSSVIDGKSGVAPVQIGINTVYGGKILQRENFLVDNFGVFESLMIQSIQAALSQTSAAPSDKDTIFIISSTKGEIDSLSKPNDLKKVNLFESSRKVSSYFNNPNQPVVISNACISGSLAILTAKRLIEAGLYRNAVVCGCDLISDFITSGFNSLQAISSEPCKPFDANRKGINMGEAAATIIITKDKGEIPVCITSGATSNDANHISGPSRTGEELGVAIRKAMQASKVTVSEIDFINAHGTGTLFNDEMEANAFSLTDFSNVPLNSLKGYYGHTLGAAGVLESAISVMSLLNNELIPSMGYETPGVTKPINVIRKKEMKPLKRFLKTASGFGGCNATLIFEKTE